MNNNLTHIGHEMKGRTFSSVLKDTGVTPSSFIKTGAGQLLLSANNLYTGDTVVLSGALKLGVSSAIPSSANIYVKAPYATFSLGAFSQTINSMSGEGIVFVGAGGELSINGENDFTYVGTTSGAGSIIKNQPNTVILTRNNYATGPLTINSGTVILSAGVFNHSLVSLNNNSVLKCISGYGLTGEYGPHSSGLSDFIDLRNFNNRFAVANTALLFFSTQNPTNNFDFGSSSQFFPAGYNGSNTNEDRWVGWIFAPVAGTYTFYTASDDGSMLWIDGNLVVFNNFAQAVTEKSGTIVLQPGYHEIIIGFFNSSGNQGFYCNWTVPSAAKTQIPMSTLRCGPCIFSISGDVNTVLDIDQCPYFTISQKLNTFFTGTISGRGSLLKTGVGQLVLTGDNSFTGNLILAGGNLTTNIINSPKTNGPLGNNDLLRFWGGTLKYGGSDTVVYHNIESQGASVINVTGAGVTVTLAGQISGYGDICKAGVGTLIISGNSNTYVTSGGTTVYEGTTIQGYENAIGKRSRLTLSNRANTFFYLNGYDTYIGAISGGGTTGGVVSIGTNTLYIGTQPVNTTFSGKISGIGNVIKVGTGIQTFNTQAQPFTSNLTISGGMIILGYQSSGTGTLSCPAVNVMPGAVIRQTVSNAFGYSGSSWVKTLNLNYGRWDCVNTNLGDLNFFNTPINITGGNIAFVGGNNLVFSNSCINTYPATSTVIISGAFTITNRQSSLPFNIFKGSATPYDCVLNTSGGCQMPIVKGGNGSLYLSSMSTPGTASPNSISRSFTVSGGTLLLGGNDVSPTSSTSFITNTGNCQITNLCTVTGATYIVSGGVLCGTGKSSGSVIISDTIGAMIYGGTGSGNNGVLNVKALTFNGPNSTLVINTLANNSISRINTGVICSLGGCKADISGTLNVGTYTCISSIGGTITGSLPVLNANGSGRSITFSLSGSNLNIIAT